MIAHVKKQVLYTFTALILMAQVSPCALAEEKVNGKIHRVVDGDTLLMWGGERVRLLGIDAPERGQPLFESATKRLRELLSMGDLTLRVCDQKDTYDRQLATFIINGINVNTTLLQEGMALPMLIPPCGTPVAKDVLKAAAKGTLSGKGIYSKDGYRIISHRDAEGLIGKRAVVKGKVKGLYRGRKAWHLNFGEDHRTDFTAVLFKEGQARFQDLGLDLAELVGTEVLVIGKVKRYNGAEIIVRGPEQILPVTADLEPRQVR